MRQEEGGRRDERRARVAAGERRAQMYLAGLRWLEGFEADGRWYVVGSDPGERVVDGPALAGARRIVNRLRRDHVHALARQVGDVAAWTRLMDGVLAYLGARTHGKPVSGDLGALVPPRLRGDASALASAHPELQPLVSAAASAWALRPPALAAALAWMRPRARELAKLIAGAEPMRWRRALGLAQLATEDEAGVDALIALALADVADQGQTDAALSNLIARLSGHERAPSPPPVRSGAAILPWIDRLLASEPRPRARALTLLRAIDLAAALGPASTWEREHAGRLARAQAVASELRSGHGPGPIDLAHIIAGVERAQKALPPELSVAASLKEIDTLAGTLTRPDDAGAPAETERERVVRALIRLLPALPPGDAPAHARVRFIAYAASVSAGAREDRLSAVELWEALAAEHAAGAPDAIFAPWNKVLAGKRQYWIEEHMVGPLKRPAEIRRLGTALVRLARTGQISMVHAHHLSAALSAGLDIDEAATLTRRLEPLERDASAPLLRGLIALCGRDIAALIAPLRIILALWDRHSSAPEKSLATLCERAAARGQGWLILGLLERDGRRVLDLAELGRCVPERQWPVFPDVHPPPAWIAAYPPALAESLTHLTTVDPAAEQTAHRRLGSDLPDRAALAREAATLRARPVLGPREARRLANLEVRMAAPRSLSAVRLARLSAKLHGAAVETGAARFSEALATAAQRRLTGQLGIAQLPGWPHDRMQRSILLGLLELKPAARALAARLLQARSGPPPWDLRDQPANRAFLDRLRARGGDPTPWLDAEPVTVAGDDHRPLELALSRDPLEVFAMGAHFHTCLAPEGGNFFSVVTNAADINKRVLYARRDGTVIGRCLLALTDATQLLTFNPYCHDKQVGFERVVREFVLGLAERMHIKVAATGRVALLLGSDWYDDGAHDLVGQYPALETPEFAQELLELPPSQLIARLERHFGRTLDDVTLPVVVGLTALQQRPELIEPLIPHLLATATLSEQTLNRAAELARRSGDLDAADRLLLGPALRADLTRDGVWHWGQVLARRRPSVALARLRQTRPRGVRNWKDEQGDRLAVAALALEQLHRPRQAAAFLRRAIEDAPWLADDVRDHLVALEQAR